MDPSGRPRLPGELHRDVAGPAAEVQHGLALDDPAQHGGGAERQKQRRLLVGGSSGHLFVIDPTKRTLEVRSRLMALDCQ